MTQDVLLALLTFLLLGVEALYEDQAGKFDWRQQMVGRPVHVLLDRSSSGGYQRLLVATEDNVLAALHPKSGQLLWRRVLEAGPAGRVHLLAPADGDVLTVSGHNLVRLWSAATGLLVSEKALDVTRLTSDQQQHVLVSGQDLSTLVLVRPGDTTVVHSVDRLTGHETTSELTTPWAAHASCVSGERVLVCRSSDSLFTLSADSPHKFTAQPLPAALTTNQAPRLRHVGGDLFAAEANGRLSVVRITPSFEVVREMAGDTACLAIVGGQQVVYAVKNVAAGPSPAVELSAAAVTADGHTEAPAGRVTLTPRHGAVAACHVTAAPRHDGGRLTTRALLVGRDDAVTMATVGGDVLWTREEALANIVSVEVVDLPMSAGDVSIEEEFGDPAAGAVTALLRRIASQWSQLAALATSVVTGAALTGRTDVTHLTRDRFNLHKMLVVATVSGKLLGLHSQTGAVLWAVPVAGLGPLDRDSVVLGLQRGTAHFPHAPEAVLLAGRRLVTFNPITGGALKVHQLDYDVMQASLLPLTDTTHIKPLLILDTVGVAHVWPSSAAPLVRAAHHKLFFYTADVSTGRLQGYAVTEELSTVPSWRLDLSSQGQTIRRVLAKSPQERVHSQGRVLADRSVLYKYSNPSLLLVITDADDAVHKHSTSVYLVDAVTGHLVYSHVQRRVRCPCHAVHSENWLIYSVYNERARRTELTSIELFEGKTQSNASAFSSLEWPPQPMVEKQTFIFPTQIEAMRETVTEKGITTKFILFCLPSGSVVALNRALLDPRRPLTAGRASDEGLPPYTPELPLPSVAVVNYNQTLLRVQGVITSPSGLESTCLVFVHGLDLYHTRVFPSNMFDQLKDDFDTTFIVLVLTALVTGAVVSRRLSQRRALHHAWK